MSFRLAADGVLLLHLLFILFALLGGALAFRWRWLPLLHLPAAAWGLTIELSGGVCPLTYAENYLRYRAGQSGYSESFIEHYLLAVVYPAGLTTAMQLLLAGVLLLVNLLIYGALLYCRRNRAD